MIRLKKNFLYVVDGETCVYCGQDENRIIFKTSEGNIRGYTTLDGIEIRPVAKPKGRTIKKIEAELDVLRETAEKDGYKFVNESDKQKFYALRNEIEAIRLYRKEKAERKAKKNTNYEAIYQEAREAGLKAGKEAIPTPMVVQEHANQLDDNSAVKQEWYVSEGACGFAWVNVRDRKFGLWLKAVGYGDHDSYYGGVTVWVGDFGQSIARKEAYAGAFAEVLEKHGIEAGSNSRLD
jgi:hypothetical protein